MKTPISFLFIISLISLLSSCSNDDDLINDMGCGIPQQTDDCTPYTTSEPTVMMQSGTWSEANEDDLYESLIQIPADDLGGGYVFLKVTQGDQDLRPTLIITSSTPSGGAIVSGSSNNTNNELIREANFEVYPGMEYNVLVSPFFNAAEYPVDYTISWAFFSRMDCFEPNNTFSEAKEILLDRSYEAYAIAGYIDNFVQGNDENTYDFYKVDITEAGQYEFELSAVPENMRLNSRWFNASGISISSTTTYLGSETDLNKGRPSINTTNAVIDPGTYIIEIHPSFYSTVAEYDNVDLPNHFNDPYTFEVRKL